MTDHLKSMAHRFRGYLPVIVDVETGGFNAATDALLEIAAITVAFDEQGILYIDESQHFHINPFPGAHLCPKALAFTGIDPFHPFRFALDEKEALQKIFKALHKAIKAAECRRAILVGHNSPFDLSFISAAVERCQLKRNPFHPFSTLDTVSLSALALGQTVLAKAAQAAGIPFDSQQAHSALYDANRTAELFCHIVNRWHEVAGWPGEKT